MRRMQRSYAVCPCTWFEDVWRAQALPGPEKVLDALRCELVCEDMLGVQEAFKGLEVSCWYKFVNFPITAQTWKFKVTIAVSGRKGGLRHWAKHALRFGTWGQNPERRPGFPANRCSAGYLCGDERPQVLPGGLVHGSMGRWVDAMEFSWIISEEPSLDYWTHLHSYGAMHVLGEKHWKVTDQQIYTMYTMSYGFSQLVWGQDCTFARWSCRWRIILPRFFSWMRSSRGDLGPGLDLLRSREVVPRTCDMGPVEHHGNSRAPCAFVTWCALFTTTKF